MKRLITRDDFDSICCAALLREIGVVDEVLFASPNDIQNGRVPVTDSDVLANVPYVDGCGVWFDHHSSEVERVDMPEVVGACMVAPSAARVIVDYYHDKNLSKFAGMLEGVDAVDSASFTAEQVSSPRGWVLLGFLCDPRTGLEKHPDIKQSHLSFIQNLIEPIRTKSIDEILELPDVKLWADVYNKNSKEHMAYLKSSAKKIGDIIFMDNRGKTVPPGNRFLIYTIFPECNISIRVSEKKDMGQTIFSIGHSVVCRTSYVDVGSLCLRYGGGGHIGAGTCRVDNAAAEQALQEVITEINGAANE